VPYFYISYACLICARNEKNNSVNFVAIQYINKILLKYEEERQNINRIDAINV